MNCPVCDGQLRQVEKHGVEVDKCPDCKGVWLDRGELDKIIQMISEGSPAQAKEAERTLEGRAEYHDNDFDSKMSRDDKERNQDPVSSEGSKCSKPKKRETWLGDIFDMFGGD